MASEASSATAGMSSLSLDNKKAPNQKTKKEPVADSWEEADSASENDEQPTSPQTTSTRTSGFAAPPPTPSSPTYSSGAPWQSLHESSPTVAIGDTQKRPEKTDAVARRMIASALGVKAPKATEEQKAYDRALREKEQKRREQEKEAERRRAEEAEKAKAAIWED